MYSRKEMQREISTLDHENAQVSASRPFTGDHNFATSPYHSYLSPKHSPLLDYLNEGPSISRSKRSEDALPLYVPQIQQQQQQLHRDLMERQQNVLNQLRDVTKQKHALRQENVNLKMANLDLNNRLNLLLNSSLHDADMGPHLYSPVDRRHKMGFGAEEWASENEGMMKSPTSVMGRGDPIGVERVHLPKSISVRSSGYLKTTRSSSSSSSNMGGDCINTLHQNNLDNGTQKVFLKGVEKEQPLELEVYNQGMFKTELCNKWQQIGTCPYGENCQFAHGIEELRPVLRHPRYKTEVCRMVLNGVPCPYGHRCHFRHTLTEEEQLTRAMSSLDPFNYR